MHGRKARPVQPIIVTRSPDEKLFGYTEMKDCLRNKEYLYSMEYDIYLFNIYVV